MGMMIDGQWEADDGVWAAMDGKFHRSESQFHCPSGADKTGEGGFHAQKDRYYL